MPLLGLAAKLLGRIDGWVHFPTQALCNRVKCLEYACEGCSAHDHQIDVAAGPLFSVGDRPIDERRAYRVSDLGQAGT